MILWGKSKIKIFLDEEKLRELLAGRCAPKEIPKKLL